MYFLFYFLKICVYLFGSAGSLLLHMGFYPAAASRSYSLAAVRGLLLLQSVGSGPSGSGSVARGFSALQRVESSQIRDGASVCCIARQTLNHEAMREAIYIKYNIYFNVLKYINFF